MRLARAVGVVVAPEPHRAVDDERPLARAPVAVAHGPETVPLAIAKRPARLGAVAVNDAPLSLRRSAWWSSKSSTLGSQNRASFRRQ